MFVVSASRIELLRTIVTFHRRCNVSSLRNRFKEGYLDYVQTKPPKWMCSWSYLKIHSIRMMTSTPLKGIKDPQEIVLREQSKELLQKTREHVKEEKEKKTDRRFLILLSIYLLFLKERRAPFYNDLERIRCLLV